jgi:hypothetical protein
MTIINWDNSPVVSVNFWLFENDKDVDLTYINDLLGMTGKTRLKSDSIPATRHLACSYWKVNMHYEKVVSLADVIKEFLNPLCEKADTITELMDCTGLLSMITVTIYCNEETYLPMLVFDQETIKMMNALHISEFSIDPFY